HVAAELVAGELGEEAAPDAVHHEHPAAGRRVPGDDAVVGTGAGLAAGAWLCASPRACVLRGGRRGGDGRRPDDGARAGGEEHGRDDRREDSHVGAGPRWGRDGKLVPAFWARAGNGVKHVAPARRGRTAPGGVRSRDAFSRNRTRRHPAPPGRERATPFDEPTWAPAPRWHPFSRPRRDPPTPPPTRTRPCAPSSGTSATRRAPSSGPRGSPRSRCSPSRSASARRRPSTR